MQMPMSPLRLVGYFLPSFVRRRLTHARSLVAGRAAAPPETPRHKTSSQRSVPQRPHVASSTPAKASPAAKTRRKRRSQASAGQAAPNADGSAAKTFSGSGLADYLGMSPATITNLRRDRKIYGYSINARSIAYPTAQIVQGGGKRKSRVIDGVGQVLAHFTDADAAWVWLTAEQTGVGTCTRPASTPLDELRRGRLKPVLAQLPAS